MSEKIALKEVLAAVDMNARGLWDEIDEDQRKALKSEFFILNRYVSSVKTNNVDIQQHYILAVNEYFNKHWYTLQKHPKLLWQLLSMCGHESGRVFFHEWIGFKKKNKDDSNKKIKYLSESFPDKKADEIKLLAQINSVEDLKEHARTRGIEEQEIAKLF